MSFNPSLEEIISPKKDTAVILGGGLTGLSAGYHLTKAGKKVMVFEADSKVGGLSKTIVAGDFRFDLGGHRFFTTNQKTEKFVRDLMYGELLFVSRKSKIYLREKYFDYPLKPMNSIFGLGPVTTMKILLDYGMEKLKRKNGSIISLEDWVVSNFGRSMFNIYFKEYSEKVWGIDCKSISQDWVARRIYGLSLGKAIKNAFFKFTSKELPTLADRFLYPTLGIGRISERLEEEINRNNNSVHTSTFVKQINHRDFKVESIEIGSHEHALKLIKAEEFVSSIPINALVRMLNPAPPSDIHQAASMLKYRDLMIVAVMINKPQVTDQTWIYIPEQKIPFGRIHEPKNWSRHMAPEDKTLLVMEYFCFKNDRVWMSDDKELIGLTVKHLEALDFIKSHEVLDGVVIRVPKAYPLFEVGYGEHAGKVINYLSKFKNLHMAGRGGMFKYYNMDHAIESGIEAAEAVCKQTLTQKCGSALS